MRAQQCILNNNPKIIFWVLDWSIVSGKKQEKYYGPADQIKTLTSALKVFENDGPNLNEPSKNCTMSKAVATAILITKSDLMDADTEEKRIEIADEYLYENCLSFFNDLKYSCQKYNINRTNNNNPYILTFSLGKFLVGNTVLFDGHDADEIIEFIQEKDPIKSVRETPISFWGMMRKWFS